MSATLRLSQVYLDIHRSLLTLMGSLACQGVACGSARACVCVGTYFHLEFS
jgi:hypothetical protein